MNHIPPSARRMVACAIGVVGLAAPLTAQRIGGTGIADRARTEQQAPRPDSTTASWDVGGVRVIHRRAAANQIVVASLYLLGGSRQVTSATAGVEPLLLAASERGTKQFTREALRQRLARSGSQIVTGVQRDWSMISLRSTRDAFTESWAVFADRIVAPRLEPSDVAAVRDQLVAAVRQRRDSPEDWAEHLADSLTFVGHAYEVDPIGNERSLASLDVATLRTYHAREFVTSRMMLVVVGDVTRPVIDSLVTTSLATLPRGEYQWTLPDTLLRRPTDIVRDPRSLATNYLVGYAPGPRAGHPDYAALRVATAILSGELFSEVRSRQALTYAVAAPFKELAVGAVGLTVSTTEPEAALVAMRSVILELQGLSIDARALGPLILLFLTEYFLNNETNAAQADFLARAQLYEGDWRKATDFARALRTVTPADIQRVLRTYYQNLQFAYVGDPAKLDDAIVRGGR
jgi:zinc protease